MPEINDEMKVTADYAITSAKERYGLVLDYTEDSLVLLGNILEKIYWGFSSHARTEGQDGLIYNTAIIWGSYVGEYMRLKWGGTWILKGTDRVVSITSIEFSPINFVYQKITDHPEYSVENYVFEAKKLIYTSVIHPKKSQFLSENIGQPEKQKSEKLPKKPVSFDKRLVYPIAGVLALLLISFACMIGYSLLKSGGLTAFGLLDSTPTINTDTPQPTIESTATAYASNTPTATMTELPTYTPIPTNTPRPTRTPLLVNTQTSTSTPTETQTPTNTSTEYIPPTRTASPTSVSIHPTNTSSPSNTPLPTPTKTTPPPSIVSCSVSPSQVTALTPTTLTFSVSFSAPNYGFNVSSFDPSFPGQVGCTGSAGSDTVTCNGVSGLLPSNTTVKVTLDTSLGPCGVSYSSP